MPDYQQFSIARTGPQQMTVPTWSINLLVTDSKTGATIFNFTGANALSFPQVLGTLTTAQQDEFVRRVMQMLISWKIGEEV